MKDMRLLLLGTLLAAVFATAALAGDVVVEPGPGDLTGTWAGEMKCKVFDGEETVNSAFEGGLFVVQDGTVLALTTELFEAGGPEFVRAQGVASDATMCGTILPKKPTKPEAGVGALSPLGAGGFVEPSSFEELQAVAIKTKTFAENSKGETGKLTGKGTILPVLPFPLVGSCRWKFSRIDTLPPAVDPSFCDEVLL